MFFSPYELKSGERERERERKGLEIGTRKAGCGREKVGPLAKNGGVRELILVVFFFNVKE